MTHLNKTDSEIIDDLGGNEAVAKLCEPTLGAVVSGWRSRGIPVAWRKYLQVIRPVVFGLKEGDIQKRHVSERRENRRKKVLS